MLLQLENPDFRYVLRGADVESAWVNDLHLLRSFILSPTALIENWRPTQIDALTPADLEPLLALNPALVILGSGPVSRFPSQAVMAACLTRGIGIEIMSNAAAARTFNVLAMEARKVVAGFLLEPNS